MQSLIPVSSECQLLEGLVGGGSRRISRLRIRFSLRTERSVLGFVSWAAFIFNKENCIPFGFFHVSRISLKQNIFIRHLKAILWWHLNRKIIIAVLYLSSCWLQVGIRNLMFSVYNKPTYIDLAEITVQETIVCSLHIIGTTNSLISSSY